MKRFQGQVYIILSYILSINFNIFGKFLVYTLLYKFSQSQIKYMTFEQKIYLPDVKLYFA